MGGGELIWTHIGSPVCTLGDAIKLDNLIGQYLCDVSKPVVLVGLNYLLIDMYSFRLITVSMEQFSLFFTLFDT